ncbi:hypothetical protein GCM10020358_63300 [Amorphoplanes nipponensis]|uniref:Uncharacterized protein n=1 Tax=Actinoplanes nipponensis TaxID=135950 RepID=A0A919MWI5_9ACTN|nr:hypothetical protein Ani05nite_57990 [Actinoplanes nipponensis]
MQAAGLQETEQVRARCASDVRSTFRSTSASLGNRRGIRHRHFRPGMKTPESQYWRSGYPDAAAPGQDKEIFTPPENIESWSSMAVNCVDFGTSKMSFPFT